MVVWVMLAEAGQKKLNSMHFKQSFQDFIPNKWKNGVVIYGYEKG